MQDAIAAIGKTFELDGYPNPLYRDGGINVYHLCIARQLESFRRTDPPTRSQLAIPIAIPNWIFWTSRLSNQPQICAIGELCLMAFFFLLPIGKYMQQNANRSTHTQQF